MKKIAIIGGGNMGAAIFTCIRRKFSVKICESSAERREYLKKTFKIKTEELAAAVKASDVIILAVKPQDFDLVLGQVRSLVNSKKLIVSIAAGITASYIENKLGAGVRVVRTMPNMPALIEEGITAISKGRKATDADVKLARSIFDNVGETVVVEEHLIDAVTAVSGSGPAYLFLFAECLMKAAQTAGLSEPLAKDLVYQMLLGSVHLLEGYEGSAAELRAKVTSKGGTTQAAMDVFMANNIEKIITDAVIAAKKRAEELSQ